MKTIIKTNTWFWAFLVLLVINIATIGSLIFTMGSLQNFESESSVTFSPPGPRPPINFTKVLQEKVGYSQDEIQNLRQVRTQHMQRMKNFKINLHDTQRALFDEISNEKPDTIKINELKLKIGIAHDQIIDESISFYESVRANSSPEQLTKLNQYFRESLFNPAQRRGDGMGNGRGRGNSRN